MRQRPAHAKSISGWEKATDTFGRFRAGTDADSSGNRRKFGDGQRVSTVGRAAIRALAVTDHRADHSNVRPAGQITSAASPTDRDHGQVVENTSCIGLRRIFGLAPFGIMRSHKVDLTAASTSCGEVPMLRRKYPSPPLPNRVRSNPRPGRSDLRGRIGAESARGIDQG